MDNLLGRQRTGDLYVVFDIEFPKKLSQIQKDQLAEIEDLIDE